jgi:glycosyltransferase involved in cell wall biosynthesis
MNFTYILPGFSFYDGCIHNRNYQPALKLQELGHKVDMTLLNPQFNREKLLTMDFVVFSRYYPMDLSPLVLYLKRNNIKIIYETDDDLFNIPATNPTKPIIDQFLESVHMLGNACDLITTTTPYFETQLKKRYPNKPICVIPNAIDFTAFLPRKRASEKVVVGWTGGVTHCIDLVMALEVIIKLQEKYDFNVVINGVSANPIEAQSFDWEKSCELGLANPEDPFMKSGLGFVRLLPRIKNFSFIPFYPSALYPQILSNMDLDIGLAPLIDNVFGRSKSNLKYYEYAAVESVTIASDVVPYNTEITQQECLVAETETDWYNKLEFMIKNKNERERIQKEQTKWMHENRDIKKVIHQWEKAFEQLMETK